MSSSWLLVLPPGDDVVRVTWLGWVGGRVPQADSQMGEKLGVVVIRVGKAGEEGNQGVQVLVVDAWFSTKSVLYENEK